MQCTYITKCCNNGWVGSGNHIEVDINIQNDGPNTNEIVEVGTSKTNQPVDYVSRKLNLTLITLCSYSVKKNCV